MAPEFQTQSNWFRVGNLFATKLDEAGKGPQAEAVRKKIVDTLNQINNARAARAR